MSDTREAGDLPQVVVMCGVSGSGKTRMARRLEQEGYLRLSPDLIVWQQYGDSVSSLPPERMKAVFAEASDRIFVRLDEMLRQGRRVVVDATMCRRAKRDHVRRICRSHGAGHLIVYLDIPLEVLAGRLAGRKGEGPDDQAVSPDQLRIYYTGFDRPQPGEESVVRLTCADVSALRAIAAR